MKNHVKTMRIAAASKTRSTNNAMKIPVPVSYQKLKMVKFFIGGLLQILVFFLFFSQYLAIERGRLNSEGFSTESLFREACYTLIGKGVIDSITGCEQDIQHLLANDKNFKVNL